MCAVELRWNLQVRSSKPDPLGADIVHVSEDCRDGASLAGRFGFPGGKGKMLDKKLVDAIIDGKYLDCRGAEWSLRLAFTRGHGGSLLRRIHGVEKVNRRQSQKHSQNTTPPQTGEEWGHPRGREA